MRPSFTVTCVLALLPASATAGLAPQSEKPSVVNNVTLLISQRTLVDDAWGPLDEQSAFAIEYDSYSAYALAGFEVGFSYANADDTSGGLDAQSDVWEAYAGVRKTFALAEDRLHPYLSTGLSYSKGEVDVDLGSGNENLDDSSFGFYLRGGVYYTFGAGFNVGLDYRRLLVTEYSEGSSKVDGDFDQFSLGLGYSF